MNKLKVIDLFAGVGGLSYGFAQSNNFEVVAANELLPDMAEAYSLNHPNVRVYNSDIKNFCIQTLKSDIDLMAGDIDIIVGGPPCQAYSTIGKRSTNDPRGKLFKEYYRVVSELRPTFFIFENVRGLLSMNDGKLMEEIVSMFKNLGYFVKHKMLNAVDYGTPQNRVRVIITGSKIDGHFEYPNPTHGKGLKPYITLGEALSDLPLIKSGEESTEYVSKPITEYQRKMRKNAPCKLQDHNTAKNNAKLVAIMSALPDGGNAKDLPENLRPKSGYGNTYCKLWWDKPATTITRNLGTPSSSRCIHPRAPRALTTREGARLQGFPDSYQFYGSRTNRNLQIGNAVPTQLSVALTKAVEKYLL